MIKKGSYTSNFLILFSGNSLGQLVPLLFGPVIARLFVEEEMAVMANFIALAGMVSIIAAGRYEKAIVLPAERSKAMNLVGIAIRIIGVVTILSVLTYIFRHQIDTFYKEGKLADMMYLMVVAVPLYALTSVFTEWLIREKKFRSLTISGVARSVFISLFSITFGFYNFGASGLVLGTIVGLFVSLIMMYISARSSLDFSLVSKTGMLAVAKEYRDFPMVNSAHAFADILFGQFILYAVITRQFGLAELGLFTVMARYLQASMKAVGNAVGQLYYRDASELVATGQSAAPVFFRSIRLVLVFAVPVFLLILFFGPDLFELYAGPTYRRSGEIAQIMIIPLFINFVVSPVSPTPIIYRRQQTAFVLSLVSYVAGLFALLVARYSGYDFYGALTFYAAVQSVYYLVLFGWYYKLMRSAV